MTEKLSHDELCNALHTGVPATIGMPDVRKLLGVAPGTLSRWVREGTFPPESGTSQRNSRRWNSADIARWMKEKGVPLPEPKG